MAETFSPVTLTNDTGQKLNATYFNRLETNLETFDDRTASLELGILTPVAVTYASTITLDASTGGLFRITATGDFTLNSPINATTGQTIAIEVLASGGNRTVSFAGGGVTPVLIESGLTWVCAMRYNLALDTWILLLGSSGSAAAGYGIVQEDGAGLTTRSILNFVGRSVTAADNAGATRTDVTVQDTPAVHAVGNSGTALTVDVSTTSGPAKTITMTGNCTFTFTSPAAGRLWVMDLRLAQDATGGRTATWPGTVKWAGGAGAPTLSTAANAVDWLTFATWDGGTTWLGMVVGKAFA